MGCRSGKKTTLAAKTSALVHAGSRGSPAISYSGNGSLAIWCSGSLFSARPSYRGAGMVLSSIASAI